MATNTQTVWEQDDPENGGVALFQYTFDDTAPDTGGTGDISEIGWQNLTARNTFIEITDLVTGEIVNNWAFDVTTETPLTTQQITALGLHMVWKVSPKTGIGTWTPPYGYSVRWPA